MTLDNRLASHLHDTPKGYGSGVDLDPKPSGCLIRWFCVATNYGQQFLAEASLRADGWEAFFPLHLDRQTGRADRIVPMFPGYGFVAFSPEMDYGTIYRARGVYRLLGKVGAYGPCPMPVDAVEGLIERTSPRRIVDDPGVMAGVVYLAAGSQGRVTQGPMTGWEGLCTMSSSRRVKLLLEMFGTKREVEFPAELVSEAAP